MGSKCFNWRFLTPIFLFVAVTWYCLSWPLPLHLFFATYLSFFLVLISWFFVINANWPLIFCIPSNSSKRLMITLRFKLCISSLVTAGTFFTKIVQHRKDLKIEILKDSNSYLHSFELLENCFASGKWEKSRTKRAWIRCYCLGQPFNAV